MSQSIASNIILKTEGLTKHYGGVHALEDANFELRRGEHVAIMGDNGAGKSTFVRQITGVEQRTRGRVLFDGEEVHFKGPLEAREAGIETVFQNLALADDLDVPSNLFLGREKILVKLGPFSILDFKGMRTATEDALKRTAVKIPNLANTIRNMSGGQRQRLNVARLILASPDVWLLDEPTEHLDAELADDLMATVAELAGKASVVVATHRNADTAMCDQTIRLADGTMES